MDGYLAEAASYALIGGIFGAMQQKLPQLWSVSQNQYLSYGITTVQDGGSDENVVKMLLGFDQANMMKLDVVVYESCSPTAHDTMQTFKDLCGKYTHRPNNLHVLRR